MLHSEQFEGAEFIDDTSFLWFLTPVNVGTCYRSGHTFGQRTANASILMKFGTLHKVRVVNWIVTIVVCDSPRLSNFTPVNIGTCHLLGHSYGEWWIQWWQQFWAKVAGASVLMKFATLHKSKVLNSVVTNFFVTLDPCRYWRLSSFLGHIFGLKTANLPILMRFCTLHKPRVRVVNWIVTIVVCDSPRLSNFTPVIFQAIVTESGEFNGDNSFEQELQELQFWWNLQLYTNRRSWIQWWQIFLWLLTPVGIGACHLFLGHIFGPKTTNLPILMRFCILHKPRVVNSMATIVLYYSWRLPILTIVSVGTYYLLGHSFRPKTANAPVLMKVCTLHKTTKVNSMVSILRDATGCRRELKIEIEKQFLCQKILLLPYKENWSKILVKNDGLLP